MSNRLLYVMFEFKIAKLWDGTALSIDDQVSISIEVGSADLPDPVLIVSVDAPFYNEPEPAGLGKKNLDGLWNHEVVELFIKGRHDKYLEIEMGPHGHYLVLVCDGYRQCFSRGIEPISYQASITESRWTGTMTIPLHLLPPSTDIPSARYSFNAYAIHGLEPERMYAALYGPRKAEGDYAVADFHKLELFEHFPLTLPSTEQVSVWEGRSSISVDNVFQKASLDIGEESPRLRE